MNISKYFIPERDQSYSVHNETLINKLDKFQIESNDD
jgi:hypothetical protein